MKKILYLLLLMLMLMKAQVSSFSVEVDKDSILMGNTLKVTYVLKMLMENLKPLTSRILWLYLVPTPVHRCTLSMAILPNQHLTLIL